MPAQAQTYLIDDLAKHFQCAIEDNYDVEQALVATDVMAVTKLDGSIYTGDDKEVTFLGDDGIDIPVFKGNPANGFDVDLYGSASGAKGTPDLIAKLFRMCGGDETVTASTSVSYVAGDKNSLDSLTAKMFRKISDAKYLEYLTTGARGQLNYAFQNSEKGVWSVTNMVGTYHRPVVINTAQTSDYGTQKTALPKDVNYDTTAEISWGGVDMCVESMTVTNVFGWEYNKVDFPGCKSTRAKRVQPKISMTVTMPNMETAFDPYLDQETTNGVVRKPFIFTQGFTPADDGKILTIKGDGANEMQMVNVQETTVGNDVGISFDLLCLTGLEVLRT